MRSLVASALAIAAVGCVSGGDIDLLHREITDVSRQVENIGRQSTGKEDLKAMSQRLADQNSQVLKSNADIQVELQQLRDQIEALQSNLEATNQRLEELTNELAAARDRTSGSLTSAPGPVDGASSSAASPGAEGFPGTAAAGRPSEPAQLYGSAHEDYLRGNFDLAIQGFREYLKRYPGTDLSDNALYWIGECHYSKRQFREAIDSFTELLNGYKTSDKAAAALLKKGLAYLESGDRAQAVINLQYVLYEHPGTPEAKRAKDELAKLGVKVK
ncbi:MAG: tol-pal system protein YbgF [Candidatus Solibacter usitatus]|nr:tol-pal system protein YbgF [Candidatus Solibacter usitatus]